jgi:hypothetical protein
MPQCKLQPSAIRQPSHVSHQPSAIASAMPSPGGVMPPHTLPRPQQLLGRAWGVWLLALGSLSSGVCAGRDLYCGDSNCYSVLGLKSPQELGMGDEVATEREIKKAYRKLSMTWHPDKCKEEHCESRFMELANAYEILSEEGKRKDYDYALVRPATDSFVYT